MLDIFDSLLVQNSRCTMNLDLKLNPVENVTYPAHYYAIIGIVDDNSEREKQKTQIVFNCDYTTTG